MLTLIGIVVGIVIGSVIGALVVQFGFNGGKRITTNIQNEQEINKQQEEFESTESTEIELGK